MTKTIQLLGRRRMAAIGAGLALAASPRIASAQDYPSRPVRLIVPFAPGGPVDVIGRALGQRLSESWGRPVVIENRPGATGAIGTELAVRSPPDGYTLVLLAASHTINPSLMPNLTFHPIESLTPVMRLASSPSIIVVQRSFPANTLQEFLAYARARPGQLAVGNAGVGSSNHLAAALLGFRAGVEFLHVPFQGTAGAINALLGGQIQSTFQGSVAVQHVRSGALKALASTGATRSADLPDVPTVAESGFPGFETKAWFGLAGPANLPAAILARLEADVARELHAPVLRQILTAQSLDIEAWDSARFTASMRQELATWPEVIRAANITPN